MPLVAWPRPTGRVARLRRETSLAHQKEKEAGQWIEKRWAGLFFLSKMLGWTERGKGYVLDCWGRSGGWLVGRGKGTGMIKRKRIGLVRCWLRQNRLDSWLKKKPFYFWRNSHFRP